MNATVFRQILVDDIEDMFSVRARTRQNPISKERLATMGTTRDSLADAMADGTVKGWACRHESALVGFCIGNSATGEVLVMAVLPDFEGNGIGSQLLTNVTEWLRRVGFEKPWLAASPDQNIRAHGFLSCSWLAAERADTGERRRNPDPRVERPLLTTALYGVRSREVTFRPAADLGGLWLSVLAL